LEVEMKFVNLTPHRIVETTTGRVFESAGITRAAVLTEQIGELDGIPVFSAQFGSPEGLPEPKEDTVFIVSMITFEASGRRQDLVYPGELTRDSNGNPIGCIGFRK
jgi:hypothetical protein